MDNLIGIEFCDYNSCYSIRRTSFVSEGQVYAPIIKARGLFIDRDFDDSCMFTVDFINRIVNSRNEIGLNIKTGLRE